MSAPPLVDVHAHFLTPRYVEAARAAGHEHPDGMPGWPSWSVEEHLALMDAHGIDRAVLSVSSPGVHFGDDAEARDLARHVNDVAAQVCAEYPDRFDFFAALPLPDVDGALAELARCLDSLGAVGAAVKTHAHGRYLGDAAFEPLWRELDRRRGRLFVHPTSPPGWEATALGAPRPMVEFLFDTTRTVVDLLLAGTLERHPGVRVIVPHCGATLPVLGDRIALFRNGLFTDPAAGDAPRADVRDVLRELWFDLAGTPLPTQAPLLASTFGTGHVLYGSDHCWTPAAGVAEQVSSLDAGWRAALGSDWRALVAHNAQTLFGS